MRLTLRKKLKPFTSFEELSQELNLSIPELKRRIRALDEKEKLSVEALTEQSLPNRELPGEGVFELFHQFGRCLVCGNKMREPGRREIGWGEFKQCEKCEYSAHEMANYRTRKRAAEEQLNSLITEARKTQAVLKDRDRNNRELREKQPLF